MGELGGTADGHRGHYPASSPAKNAPPEYGSLYSLTMLRPRVLLIIAVLSLALLIQASGAERKIPQLGVKEVQVPFQSLKPSATFKIGKTADWVLATDDAVWVGGSKPYSLQRIDP